MSVPTRPVDYSLYFCISVDVNVDTIIGSRSLYSIVSSTNYSSTSIMTTFTPYVSYALGATCALRGVMAITSPRDEYAHMGLPLEPKAPTNTPPTMTKEKNDSEGSASPLVYLKGLREVSYGLTFMAFQQQGHVEAITVFAAIVSLVRFGDGLVVWLKGGKERYRAWGHWIPGFGCLGWAIWRWRWTH